jgi:Fic family protein
MHNASLLKIISTYRSGKYAFSANFDPAEVNITLTKARTLVGIIDSLPITSLIGDRFSPEGILEEALKAASSIDNASTTLEDAKKAFSHALSLDPAHGLSESAIKDIQQLFSTRQTVNQFTPGQYHDPPPTPARDMTGASTAHVETFSSTRILSDVKLLMLEFASWINRPEVIELGPETRAVLARFHLSAIRPFAVANAETAVAIESMLLSQAGLKYQSALAPAFYAAHAAEYRDVVERTLRAKEHDVTALLSFCFNGQVDGLNGILDEFKQTLSGLALRTRIESLREERRITRGQFDLLSVMMKEGASEPVTLKKLLRDEPYRLIYRGKSERTARRDLLRLVELKLLKPLGERGYALSG